MGKINPHLKKIKHLRATFVQYVDEKSMPGAWTDELEEDFEKEEDKSSDTDVSTESSE